MKGRAQLLLFLVVGGLAYLHADPSPPAVGVDDKLVHAAAYFVLGLALWAAIPLREAWARTLVTMGVGLLLAAGLESAQAFVPTRSVEDRDLAADVIGLLGALTVARLATAAWNWRKGRAEDNDGEVD